MRKTVIILLILCWMCSVVLPLQAQTMLGAYHQRHLIPAVLTEPEAAVLQPLQLEPSLYGTLPDFRVSAALQRHALFFLAQPENLLGDYYSNLTKRFVDRETNDNRSADTTINRRVFNMLYNAKHRDEKEMIRQQWQDTFGVDVWLAYYKTMELEDWVKQRLSIRIGRLRGEPVIDRTRVFYTFRSRF